MRQVELLGGLIRSRRQGVEVSPWVHLSFRLSREFVVYDGMCGDTCVWSALGTVDGKTGITR